MTNPLNQLLDKEMDRREFLAHVGAAIVAMIGLSSILKALNGADHQQTQQDSSAVPGFGIGPYGR
jgi:predicted tellurium resistance membrane protein TerC